MEENNTFALELNHVVKKYGFKTPVKGIDLHVPKDSVYALVGPDGSGKTLLFQLIAHLSTPSDGEIFISGIKETPIHHSPVGLYLKSTGMIPEYSIYHNFLHMAFYRKLDHKFSQIREILKLFGLKKFGRKLSGTLSPKVRSMAGIAMAFLGWPDLVLLDDPFAYLDEQEISILSEIFNKIKTEHHCAIVIACQNAKNLDNVADCYGILIDGRLEDEIQPDEIHLFDQDEIHVRVEQVKKALSLLSDYEPEAVGDGWIILTEPNITTASVFGLLMKHKVDVYELKRHKVTKQDYFNRYSSKAKGDLYG